MLYNVDVHECGRVAFGNEEHLKPQGKILYFRVIPYSLCPRIVVSYSGQRESYMYCGTRVQYY